jgi:SAM-dependent methyltransferase
MIDARRHAPATARNRDPILDVLRRHLPETGLLLEVSAGTGEHAVHFAAAFPGLTWQPTDPDPGARASIAAWAREAKLNNLRPPLALDAASDTWPLARADAVLCINMIHIAPWAAGLGLLRGAARVLPPGGPLLLYGPYRQGGAHTAPSNEAFDAGLRAQDPDWGVRDLETVAAEAAAVGFGAPEVEAMPANNLMLIFRRAA